MKASPDGIIITDTDGVIQFVSDNCCKMFGYNDQNELIGKLISDIADERVSASNIKLKSKEEFKNIYKGIRKDGSIFYFEPSREALTKNNKTIACIDVIRDISDRINYEENLNKINNELVASNRRLQDLNEQIKFSDNNYHQLFSELTSGFAYHKILLDSKGEPTDYIFLEVNSAFENLTGLKREHIINKKVSDVTNGNELFWIDKYGQVAISGEPDYFESYSEQLGKYYDVTVYSPRKYYFAVIFNDITERMKIEQALSQSESKYRILTENSLVGIWHVDIDGYTLYINPKMCQYIEIAGIHELNGETYHKYFTKASIDKIENEDRKRLQGIINSYDVEIITTGGNHHTMIISAFLVRNQFGTPEGFIGTFTDISEIKRYQKALAQTEERFKLIADYTYNWEIFTDQDGEIIYSSPGVVKILGVNNDIIILKDLTDIFKFSHPDDLSNLKNQYIKLINKEVIDSFEFRIENRNIGLIYVSLSAQPVIDEANIFSGIRLSIRDINSQKIADKALYDSEQKYKAYIDNSPYGILISDTTGHFIDANNTTLLLTGFSYGEIVSMTINQLTADGYSEVSISHFETLLTYGVSNRTFPLNKKDGSTFFAQIDAVRINEDKYLAFISDITDKIISEQARDKAENELLESKQSYELLVNNINDLVCLLDNKGNLLYVNNMFPIILGYNIDEILNTNSLQYFHPDEIEFVAEDYRSTIKNLKESSNIWKIRHKAGHYLTFETRSTSFINKHGNTNTVIIATDISEKLKNQNQLAETAKQLKIITDGVPIMIAHIDENYNILFANREFQRFYSNFPTEFTYKNLKNVFSDSDFKTLKQSFDNTLNGSNLKFDTVLFNFEDEMKIVEMMLVSNQNQDNKTFFMLVSDVTDLKISEEAYKYQTEFNTTLLQTVGAIIIVIDDEANIVLFNAAAEKITGYSISSTLGKKYWELFIEDFEAEQVKTQIDRILNSGIPERLPQYILNIDKNKIAVEWTNTIMKSDKEDKNYIICTGIDISDVVNAERAFKNVSESISAYVGEKFF